MAALEGAVLTEQRRQQPPYPLAHNRVDGLRWVVNNSTASLMTSHDCGAVIVCDKAHKLATFMPKHVAYTTVMQSCFSGARCGLDLRLCLLVAGLLASGSRGSLGACYIASTRCRACGTGSKLASGACGHTASTTRSSTLCSRGGCTACRTPAPLSDRGIGQAEHQEMLDMACSMLAMIAATDAPRGNFQLLDWRPAVPAGTSTVTNECWKVR